MRVKLALFLSACLFAGSMLKAQDLSEKEELDAKVSSLENSVRLLQKFKVSGYIQTQYQWAQMNADGNNFKLTNRANAFEQSEFKNGDLNGYGRFGIRRGRIKFTYEDGIASGVVQIDVTEKGISSDRNVVMFKDVYLQVKDPWIGTCNLKSGIFDRPFGFEIANSSSRRESPERARIFQSLFPDERDLGAMLTLQPAKSSPLNILKLEAGLFAGNGIKPQFTTHMDFIGHLSVNKQIGNNTMISGGVSAYLGGVMQNDSSLYVMKDKKFELESKSADNLGKFAKRQYIGVDIQFSTITPAGFTQLRGEYIFGEHPGSSTGQYEFKFNGLPAYPATNSPIYMRKVAGGYVMLVQDLGQTPFSAVVKYDWYNPNTEVSGNEIAVAGSGTTTGDITRSNIGLGIYWRINPALRLTAYYDIVRNETTENLKDTHKDPNDMKSQITAYGYEGSDRKADVFTLRLQYKF
jgi:hypothetical protein